MDDGGPSVTARRVAAHRLGLSRFPAAYGIPAADEALAADVAAGLVAPANRMHDYLAARTSFFDRTVVGAIDRGVRQVVVGAAGYDGRSFRYAKRGVRWFEVDHPATQRDKLERLARLGIAASQVRFVEADFTRDRVADRLRAAGLEATLPSLFLLEGIAVYLESAVLETVLQQFRQVAAPGSRLAISVSLSREHDEGARARFQAAVAALGEPARSTFDASQAEGLLARAGWQTIPGRAETAAQRERLHSAGLLTAIAGPRARQASAPSKPAKPSAPSAPLRPSASPAPSAPPPGSLALASLLSQALVAFTIESDNEAEHRLPHRTTDHGASGGGDGAWLVSLVMWENCLRHVTDQPITVGELETRARTGTNLDGMRRWGYITIDGTARKVHKGRPGPDAVLRATAAGLRARQVWLPLPGLIEPPLTGTSKEAVSWALGILIREHLAVEEPDPAAGRGKVVWLVPQGLQAQRAYHEVVDAIVRHWRERFSTSAIDGLRVSLETLAIAPDGEPVPLLTGLEPYPDNWRAALRRPATLPHYPMVLHRGGYPDGS